MTHQNDDDTDPEVILVALAETAALGCVVANVAVVVEVVAFAGLLGIGVDRHGVGFGSRALKFKSSLLSDQTSNKQISNLPR